jgi:hypothetical protein
MRNMQRHTAAGSGSGDRGAVHVTVTDVPDAADTLTVDPVLPSTCKLKSIDAFATSMYAVNVTESAPETAGIKNGTPNHSSGCVLAATGDSYDHDADIVRSSASPARC